MLIATARRRAQRNIVAHTTIHVTIEAIIGGDDDTVDRRHVNELSMASSRLFIYYCRRPVELDNISPKSD